MLYRIINYWLIGILLFILNGCSGDCGNCNASQGKNYGNVNLTDTNVNWLSFCPLSPAFKNIKLTNDSGFILNYSITKTKSYNDETINRRPTNDGPCCTGYYIEDFCKKQQETVVYTSKNGGIVFSLIRNMSIDAGINSKDSLTINSKKESLYIQFRLNPYDYDNNYNINTDSNYTDSKQVFHPQLTLRSKDFTSVFEIIDTNVDPNKILPKGFYYSFNKGLIGYYLTNGELWLFE